MRRATQGKIRNRVHTNQSVTADHNSGRSASRRSIIIRGYWPAWGKFDFNFIVTASLANLKLRGGQPTLKAWQFLSVARPNIQMAHSRVLTGGNGWFQSDGTIDRRIRLRVAAVMMG